MSSRIRLDRSKYPRFLYDIEHAGGRHSVDLEALRDEDPRFYGRSGTNRYRLFCITLNRWRYYSVERFSKLLWEYGVEPSPSTQAELQQNQAENNDDHEDNDDHEGDDQNNHEVEAFGDEE